MKLAQQEVELRRVRKAAANGDAPLPTVSTFEKVAIGRLVGLDFLRHGRDPAALKDSIERLAKKLMRSSPEDGDQVGLKRLLQATRELAPLRRSLELSIYSIFAFVSRQNLDALLLADEVRRQGIVEIFRISDTEICVRRRPHWDSARRTRLDF